MLLTEGFLGWGFLGKTKGFLEPKALRLNVHTFNNLESGRLYKARSFSHRADFIKTEGLKVGCGGMVGRKDGLRNGWIGGQREKVRGVYGFSSLMKHNKKGKNCAVFCFAGKRKLLYLYLRCDYMGIFL
jgi:hypothetical protein